MINKIRLRQEMGDFGKRYVRMRKTTKNYCKICSKYFALSMDLIKNSISIPFLI